ncbi:MAG: hypothetical protein EP332_03145 [Bacteroidetes bacterium]|nr:MAG: hypothetical protein EP332_03145 [Bacteroidota bacterium]
MSERKNSVSRVLKAALVLAMGMAYTTLNAQTFTYNNANGCGTFNKKSCWTNNPPTSQGKLNFSDATDVWQIASTVSHAANVTVAGTVEVSTGALSSDNGSRTLSYGTLTVNSTGSYTLNATDVLTINSLNNSGSITIEGNVTINGNLVNSGSLNVNGTLTISGNINNTGTITYGTTATATLNGAAAQSLPPNTYRNLNVSNPAGLVLGGNSTINGNLNMANGKLRVGSNTLTINGAINGMTASKAISSNKNSSIVFGSSATGTVYFDKTASDSTNRFVNVSNNGSVSLGSEMQVSGVFTPASGVFNTNDSLTFVATSDTDYAQLANGAGQINGKVQYEMYVSQGYHQIGSAVSTLISDLNQGFHSDGAIYYWDETTSNWTKADSTQEFEAGRGYYVYFGEVSTNYNFFFKTPGKIRLKGTLNRGSYTVPVKYNDGSNSNASFGAAGSAGWNLIANPFPSQMDWSSISLPSGLNNAIYIYNPVDGSYTSYVNGVGTNGGSRYIAPMQAVFVQAQASVGSGSINLNLDSTHRVTAQNNTSFYKNGSPFAGLRIKLEDQSNAKSDEHVLRFHANATAAFDAEYDAVKFINGQDRPNVYAVNSDAKSFSVNTQPEFEKNFFYAFQVECKTVGASYSIAIELDENAKDWNVVLEDTYLNTTHDISKGAYTFTAAEAKLYSDRFVLHVVKADQKLSVQTEAKSSLTLRQTPEAVYIQLTPEASQASLSLYDVKGSLIWTGQCEGSQEQKIALPSLTNNGLYILKATTTLEEKSIKITR